MKKESHNKWSIFFVMLLCFIFPNLAGCGVNLFSAKPIPVIHSGWLKKWLENPTCSPPCWEHITPGINTISEAKKILPGIPEVTSIEVDSAGDINWDLEGGGGGRTDTTFSKEPHVIIDRLLFDFIPDTLRVGEVVGVYGEPSYILTVPSIEPHYFTPQKCITEIIFEQGILLELRPSPGIKKNSISITADSIVGVMTLVTKKDWAEFFSSQHNLNSKILSSPWKGYGDYPVK